MSLTHCPGHGCPLRNDCLRARLRVYGRFDAFVVSPWDAATGNCAQHIPLPAMTPSDAAVRERAYFGWLAEGRPSGCADAHWQAARAELIASAEADLEPPFPDRG